jgi:uroporphyrin-III C-methyltransferase
VVLITAHRASESDETDWRKFVATGATLVIYMPGVTYSEVAEKLTAAGLSAETPCAVISRATTRHERVHRTTVTNLRRAPRLAAPTLLVIGEVVRFADPAAIAGEFAVPELVAENLPLPAELFKTFPAPAQRFRGDEEPIA